MKPGVRRGSRRRAEANVSARTLEPGQRPAAEVLADIAADMARAAWHLRQHATDYHHVSPPGLPSLLEAYAGGLQALASARGWL